MADALGRQWLRAGHRVLVAGRDPAKSTALSTRLGDGASAGELFAATDFGEVVFLAVRRTGVLDVVRAVGGALAGKVVIDCTNPIDEADEFRVVTLGGRSMAERIAALAPGSEVVKAFNLCSAELWRRQPPTVDGRPVVVPFCADGFRGRERVSRLITDIGCDPLPFGGLDRAGQLEVLAATGIRLLVAGIGLESVLPFPQPGPAPLG
jgi:predicted dinucleotide-binding enzyme